MIELLNVKRLEITKSRWGIKLKAELESGETQSYVASADSGLTYGDGIYFATAEEYAEDLAAF